MDTETTQNHLAFITLLTQHEAVIRASIRAVIRRQEDVDEIMQRVSIVAWQKFDTLKDHDAFATWTCVIARYEILSFQRDKARDRFELNPELIEKIATECADEVSLRSRRIAQLEQCLTKLSGRQRDMLLESYRPGRTIKLLAQKLGKSQDGLYQSLRRIRIQLKRCIEHRLAAEDGRA